MSQWLGQERENRGGSAAPRHEELPWDDSQPRVELSILFCLGKQAGKGVNSKVRQEARLGGHIPMPPLAAIGHLEPWPGSGCFHNWDSLPILLAPSSPRCAKHTWWSSAPLLMNQGRLTLLHFSHAVVLCKMRLLLAVFLASVNSFLFSCCRQHIPCCSIFTRSNPRQGRDWAIVWEISWSLGRCCWLVTRDWRSC